MDFNSKRFWIAQGLTVTMTIMTFTGLIDVNTWYKWVMGIEGLWFTSDTVTKFVNKENK